MHLKFKVLPYQSDAVNTVVDCFRGQQNTRGVRQNLDQGENHLLIDDYSYCNSEIQISDLDLLKNIREVQRRQNLNISSSLEDYCNLQGKPTPSSYKPGAKINLDIEMETGTGKTYCYTKTIFELNKRYGWLKFIVIVPTIAIREGVQKSFVVTENHFANIYGKRARFFTYSSKNLEKLESFSSDAGINVMIINIQAFNSTSQDNRRIYEELDIFQSRLPIDVIAGNRPILILDEPQKMEGQATLKALPKFNPLMILRYSATHKTIHNKVYRLDAVDAYNQKLVKKVAVCGIEIRGLSGTDGYVYLDRIEISNSEPTALVELEIKFAAGVIKRNFRQLRNGQSLFEISNQLKQYRGYVVSEIDWNRNEIEFTNGRTIRAGEAVGDITEDTIRRLQIRETIKAHLEKERQLFAQQIKVLSLIFIDSVAKYRDYDEKDEKGHYARIFEQEYARISEELSNSTETYSKSYLEYLEAIAPVDTHKGYFSIDRKTSRMSDPESSTDVLAYDLILKDKERLLSLDEPTRFIFTHSALREGWDNPNVFTICMLKHSDSTISRRQEVGRGLRLSVNQSGDRVDDSAIVHDVNVLHVVTNESYTEFVQGLQTELKNELSSRPRLANREYFLGKVLPTEEGSIEVDSEMAGKLEHYLSINGYTDWQHYVLDKYHDDRKNDTLTPLPIELEQFANQIFELVDTVFSLSALPEIVDDRKRRKNPLNKNFHKKEFLNLWERINKKAIYRVNFDSDGLVDNCRAALKDKLKVTELQIIRETGEQSDSISLDDLGSGAGFESKDIKTQVSSEPVQDAIAYDLLGAISKETQLTRRTVAKILSGSSAVDQFKRNPENFIAQASRIIKEKMASTVIEHLSYNKITDRYDTSIFINNQDRQDFSKATGKLVKHIYDHAIVDSKVEHEFVSSLDAGSEVVVYAKLPRGFQIPTPVGDYSPDWAISFEQGKVKHIYFVAETKGSLSSLEYREIENAKIKCAEKYFEEIDESNFDRVRFGVVNDYSSLLQLVNASND